MQSLLFVGCSSMPAAAKKMVHTKIQPPPGLLWTPFGWAAAELAPVVQADAGLSAQLLALDHTRLHLIALALAYAEQPLTVALASLIIGGPYTAVVDHVLGHRLRPGGLRRALAHLPSRVLEREYYRHLVDLLADTDAAVILHHSSEINHTLIELLLGVPSGLRQVVMKSTISSLWHRLARFNDSLALLVRRGAAPNLETLIAELQAASQPGQFIAKVKMIVDALPLADTLPPAYVGQARRLDSPSEILHLAQTWKNCLAGYLSRVDDGQSAIYLWDHKPASAVCLVERVGRLGWVVDDIKGPRNCDVDPSVVESLQCSFAAVSIFRRC